MCYFETHDGISKAAHNCSILCQYSSTVPCEIYLLAGWRCGIESSLRCQWSREDQAIHRNSNPLECRGGGRRREGKFDHAPPSLRRMYMNIFTHNQSKFAYFRCRNLMDQGLFSSWHSHSSRIHFALPSFPVRIQCRWFSSSHYVRAALGLNRRSLLCYCGSLFMQIIKYSRKKENF